MEYLGLLGLIGLGGLLGLKEKVDSNQSGGMIRLLGLFGLLGLGGFFIPSLGAPNEGIKKPPNPSKPNRPSNLIIPPLWFESTFSFRPNKPPSPIKPSNPKYSITSPIYL